MCSPHTPEENLYHCELYYYHPRLMAYTWMNTLLSAYCNWGQSPSLIQFLIRNLSLFFFFFPSHCSHLGNHFNASVATVQWVPIHWVLTHSPVVSICVVSLRFCILVIPFHEIRFVVENLKRFQGKSILSLPSLNTIHSGACFKCWKEKIMDCDNAINVLIGGVEISLFWKDKPQVYHKISF